MRLSSRDGASFVLRPSRYQFGANPQAAATADWDANWLVVHGDARTADGRGWTFTDPCLTTWDTRRIATWLQEVVSGLVPPTPDWSTGEQGLLHFTEPVVAFSLAGRRDGRVQVRVHLSLEALPPWLDAGDGRDIFAYFLILDLSVEALGVAMAQWDRDCAPFPVR